MTRSCLRCLSIVRISYCVPQLQRFDECNLLRISELTPLGQVRLTLRNPCSFSLFGRLYARSVTVISTCTSTKLKYSTYELVAHQVPTLLDHSHSTIQRTCLLRLISLTVLPCSDSLISTGIRVAFEAIKKRPLKKLRQFPSLGDRHNSALR